ncbi:hypothetical protein PsalMR5_04427 (plasmid) [Piscirickettsia salmonis]|uniref:hypothetical protein n=1 Tax=Piscirickettsia salmonis TaxID=1238 RepID=UPI003D7E8BA6|nr:hypothetical protein PsalSR1_04570 [Piscirickettsia salmonis]QGP61881.1 hypothetical protein PsalBI1_04523 [Piscirickettsia salmonis]QGP66502.1 hypothetical protein PsalMR5_04427 [Piscirickettsia salmonis]
MLSTPWLAADEGVFSRRCKLRRVKYLNNCNKFAQNSIYLSSQQATRYFGKLPLRVVMRFVFFRSKLRGIRPLAIENDHKAIKRKSRFRQWYQSLSTARSTIDVMEAMRMVQKGQLRYIKKQDICAQNQLIDKLFGLAA